MMRAAIKRAIERHALADYPREACGLIVAVGNRQQYVPCRNIAEDGRDFHLPIDDYDRVEAVGQILAVAHSHIDRDAQPTEADLVSCEETGLPWHIVAVGQNAGELTPVVRDWHSFEPSGYQAPLVGRSFHHGSLDCYGLIRDFYDYELGIELLDFERPEDWWSKPEFGELYLDNFERAGFQPVSGEPVYGDVILMQYRSDRTNHGGVYLGNESLKTQPDLHPIPGALLHHAMPRLSERVLYAGHWRDITRMIVRYRK
ncbi:C40 family peptidase [Alcaligenes nematophilus]